MQRLLITLPDDIKVFKLSLKDYLLSQFFYSVEKFTSIENDKILKIFM
jgi:hypothetical protein